MVQLGSTVDRTSPADRVLEVLHDPLRYKRAIVLLGIVVASVLVWNVGIDGTSSSSPRRGFHVRDDHGFGIQLNPRHRCIDADDKGSERDRLQGAACECSDPRTPTPWYGQPGWDRRHAALVAAARDSSRDPRLDMVMVGDSIVERWNGTRSLGQRLADEVLPVFEAHFTRHGGGDLEAVALGSSGDTSSNLLWHLSHGILDVPALRPAVWFVLVGTNDLGRTGCSKRNALAGVLQVAQYLRDRRPGARIVLHGLLPRSDDRASVPRLGRLWQDILFVNRELKKLCNLHEEWVYMEAPNLFLRRVKGAQDGTQDEGTTVGLGDVVINTDTMPDGLHPSVKGYELWSQQIVQVVTELLKESS